MMISFSGMVSIVNARVNFVRNQSTHVLLTLASLAIHGCQVLSKNPKS